MSLDKRFEDFVFSIKSSLPLPVRDFFRFTYHSVSLISNYVYDYRRYLSLSSATHTPRHQLNLVGTMTATFHNIEKGLALPDPRPGFGRDQIVKLIKLIELHEKRYGNHTIVNISKNVLQAYAKFNESKGLLDYPGKEKISGMNTVSSLSTLGGNKVVTREIIESATQYVKVDFFMTRHSIRQFSSEDVSIPQIVEAISVAQKSPAVCNRQFGFVHVIADKDFIKQVLDLQGGARGFSDQINKVLVVTANIRAYSGPGERYQFWIDGGLFSMSLILGLHRQNIGTVCLNWSKKKEVDRAMNKLLNLQRHEIIIMLIGIGHIRDKFVVAQSTRPDVSYAYRVI